MRNFIYLAMFVLTLASCGDKTSKSGDNATMSDVQNDMTIAWDEYIPFSFNDGSERIDGYGYVDPAAEFLNNDKVKSFLSENHPSSLSQIKAQPFSREKLESLVRGTTPVKVVLTGEKFEDDGDVAPICYVDFAPNIPLPQTDVDEEVVKVEREHAVTELLCCHIGSFGNSKEEHLWKVMQNTGLPSGEPSLAKVLDFAEGKPYSAEIEINQKVTQEELEQTLLDLYNAGVRFVNIKTQISEFILLRIWKTNHRDEM